MDTTTDVQVKEAAGKGGVAPAALISLPGDLLKNYITWAAALGILGGAGTGALASYIKTKNPKLTALDRKKDFYDRKVEEMENENWLNDLMAARKKLETSRLSDEERTELEDKYIKLINQSK